MEFSDNIEPSRNYSVVITPVVGNDTLQDLSFTIMTSKLISPGPKEAVVFFIKTTIKPKINLLSYCVSASMKSISSQLLTP